MRRDWPLTILVAWVGLIALGLLGLVVLAIQDGYHIHIIIP